MVIEEIISIFSDYPILISFFGSFFGGDGIIIFLSGLSAQGIFPLWIIFVFCLLGTLSADVLWLYLFRRKLIEKITNYFLRFDNKNFFKKIRDFAGGRELAILIIAKFAYGTRIITLSILGKSNMGYLKFVWYDFLASSIWLTAIIGVGWLGGKGISRIVNVFEEIQLFILALILFAILARIIAKKIERRFFRRGNEE